MVQKDREYFEEKINQLISEVEDLGEELEKADSYVESVENEEEFAGADLISYSNDLQEEIESLQSEISTVRDEVDNTIGKRHGGETITLLDEAVNALDYFVGVSESLKEYGNEANKKNPTQSRLRSLNPTDKLNYENRYDELKGFLKNSKKKLPHPPL